MSPLPGILSLRRNPVRALAIGCFAAGALLVVSALLSELAYLALEALGADQAMPAGPLAELGDLQMRHHVASALLQALLGVVTIVVGMGVMRRRSWARRSLEALTWLGVVLNVVMAALFAYGARESPLFLLIVLVGAVLVVVLTALSLLLIRFLRSPTVREALP